MSPLQNNYTERLIEKLRQQIEINGPTCPAAEELERLLHPSDGGAVENAPKGEPEKPAKAKKE